MEAEWQGSYMGFTLGQTFIEQLSNEQPVIGMGLFPVFICIKFKQIPIMGLEPGVF